MSASSDAPGDLELVRAFVNTLDIEAGEDAIDSPQRLEEWLRQAGLLVGPATLDDTSVETAQTLREALRALMLSNHGYELSSEAVRNLNEIAGRLPLTVRFDDSGARLEPAAGGLEGALSRLLALVSAAQASGTWKRLKACANDACRWAYYDHSKNLSRNWCSMAVCGNRMKVRAYQRRKRAKDQQ